MQIEFTEHTKSRLQIRSIHEQELIDTINYPDKIIKFQGKYYYQKKLNRGTLEAVCEKTKTHIKVITLYLK